MNNEKRIWLCVRERARIRKRRWVVGAARIEKSKTKARMNERYTTRMELMSGINIELRKASVKEGTSARNLSTRFLPLCSLSYFSRILNRPVLAISFNVVVG